MITDWGFFKRAWFDKDMWKGFPVLTEKNQTVPAAFTAVEQQRQY
jgi:hypothetical protein